ncbi:MAG: DNA polymerase III subunit beta [Deltaproteobacteria bacterium]|jgi:DNA polymerase-3 subunit beta|nr:DNA polymerase III subunit beta [Deltaproteobacteria bacterium]
MLHANINVPDLLKGVNLAVSVSEKKSSLPILSHFMLEAKDDSLIITASDLDTTIRETCPAVVYSPGRLTVPGKAFHSLVRSIKTDTVSLKEGEQMTLEFLAGQLKTTLFGLSADSFPKSNLDADMAFKSFVSKDLIDAIDKVIFSISNRDERFNLSGVYMVIDEIEDVKALRLVTSDGKRLSISTITEDADDFSLTRGVIMSKKGTQELRRLAETVGEIEIGVGYTSITAKTPTSLLEIHLLEGAFPEYRAVVPLANDKRALINRQSFLELLKRIALIAEDDFKIGKFEFSANNLHISLSNQTVGESQEAIPIEYEGETVATGFNVFFFIEALSSVKSEIVSLTFIDGKQSFLLTGPDDPGYFGVILTSTF